jgi:hypothetical protein
MADGWFPDMALTAARNNRYVRVLRAYCVDSLRNDLEAAD